MLQSGPDTRVSRGVADVGAHLDGRLAEVTGDLREVLAGEIHELDGDARIVDLLGASIRGNVEAIVAMLVHDVPADRIDAPTEAFEYARRLAERGVPVNALIRAYRLGHQRLLRWALDEVERTAHDPAVALLVTRRLVADTFAYVDRVSQQVVDVYEQERERRPADRVMARSARIRELLAEPLDVADADVAGIEATLGYALRRRHLGMVVWSGRVDGSTAIERFTAALAARPEFRARPLLSPLDRSTVWVWLASDAGTEEAVGAVRAELAGAHEVQVSCGNVESGVAGFRRTHRQALCAHGVALAAGTASEALTCYADVGVVALLGADVEAARDWVAATLGPLAGDDEPNGRLRETLRVFLASGGSYTAAAQQLTMHRNSVRYRVMRAQQVRGQVIGADRLDVELALRACRWLGPTLLTPTTATRR